MTVSRSHYEVELKARIVNPGEIERRIKRIARYVETYSCEDTYFTYASRKGYQDERFRLRLVKGKAVVTAKERKSLAGVEAHAEHEFEVEDPGAFMEFLRLFGFRVLIKKTKKIKKFLYTPTGGRRPSWQVHIELNQVRGLGRFVEIEALVKRSSDMKRARMLILDILDLLEIPRKNIELTPYTRMLYDKKRVKKPR